MKMNAKQVLVISKDNQSLATYVCRLDILIANTAYLGNTSIRIKDTDFEFKISMEIRKYYADRGFTWNTDVFSNLHLSWKDADD